MTARKPARVVALAATAFCLIVALGSLELTAWLFTEKLSVPRRELFMSFYQPAPAEPGEVCWRVQPGYEGRWRPSGWDIRVRMNNMGWRDPRDWDRKPVDVAQVGDSYAFGWGVEHGDRVSDLLQKRRPNEKIFTYAYANGFAPAHYYIYLKARPEIWPRKVLIVNLFPYNDLWGDMEWTKIGRDAGGDASWAECPGFKAGPDGVWQTSDSGRGAGARAFRWLADHTHAGEGLRRIWQSRETAAPIPPIDHDRLDDGPLEGVALEALGYVEKLKRLMATRGVRTVVLLIPPNTWVEPTWCRYRDRARCEALLRHAPLHGELLAWLRARDIEVVDTTDALRARYRAGEVVHIPDDGHWNAAGNRVAAELLMKALDQ